MNIVGSKQGKDLGFTSFILNFAKLKKLKECTIQN
jgi:hypothetical protein